MRVDLGAGKRKPLAKGAEVRSLDLELLPPGWRGGKKDGEVWEHPFSTLSTRGCQAIRPALDLVWTLPLGGRRAELRLANLGGVPGSCPCSLKIRGQGVKRYDKNTAVGLLQQHSTAWQLQIVWLSISRRKAL